MSVSRSKRPMVPFISTVTNWTDVENVRDPDLRAIEDQVEMRMKAKRLCDCELPEGFVLVTPQPKQYWLEQQLRWGFELAYGSRRFVARYMQQVTDEMQMVWALQDFTAELIGAGVFREVKRVHAMTPRQVAEMVLQ